MERITLNSSRMTIEEAFEYFIFAKNSQGLAEKTIKSYRDHLHCISKYLDTSIALSELKKEDTQQMIARMRECDLATNTIATYVRIFKVFLSWAREEGFSNLTIPKYKTEETIKEVYTDEELKILLKKPNLKRVNFAEYRSWVIINFVLNSGARASTISGILIGDVDFENGLVTYRHNKNHKVQVIPLCTQMISILQEYLLYRKGADTDYLFCTEKGGVLTSNQIHDSIAKYNRKRGVKKTSVHLFRHTFAKKYLIDCGGDAFTLQRLLGHSTLEMTRHYCNLFNVDLVQNYDEFSPLQKLTSNEKRISLKHH